LVDAKLLVENFFANVLTVELVEVFVSVVLSSIDFDCPICSEIKIFFFGGSVGVPSLSLSVVEHLRQQYFLLLVIVVLVSSVSVGPYLLCYQNMYQT
jgi:hypothetical protein